MCLEIEGASNFQIHWLIPLLAGGFKYFLFSPLLGEDFQFDYYFSIGLKPPTSLSQPGVIKCLPTSLLFCR